MVVGRGKTQLNSFPSSIIVQIGRRPKAADEILSEDMSSNGNKWWSLG